MSAVARLAVLTGLVGMSLPVNASTPHSERFGPWSVTSLSSASGDGSGEGDGPFFWLAQGGDDAELKADWKGHKLAVSITVDDCPAEDVFFQSYEIPSDVVFGTPKRQLIDRLKADFANWIAQAKFVCENDEQIEAFDLRGLDAAASYFIDRLN